MVNGRNHEQRRDGGEVLIGVAVGEHDEQRARFDCLVDLEAHRRNARRQRVRAFLEPVQATNSGRRAAAECGVNVFNLGELIVVNHREVEHNLPGMLRPGGKQVALRAESELE